MAKTNMKQMQVSFPQRQLAAIKEESERREISKAELIRRIIDAYLDQLEEKKDQK